MLEGHDTRKAAAAAASLSSRGAELARGRGEGKHLALHEVPDRRLGVAAAAEGWGRVPCGRKATTVCGRGRTRVSPARAPRSRPEGIRAVGRRNPDRTGNSSTRALGRSVTWGVLAWLVFLLLLPCFLWRPTAGPENRASCGDPGPRLRRPSARRWSTRNRAGLGYTRPAGAAVPNRLLRRAVEIGGAREGGERDLGENIRCGILGRGPRRSETMAGGRRRRRSASSYVTRPGALEPAVHSRKTHKVSIGIYTQGGMHVAGLCEGTYWSTPRGLDDHSMTKSIPGIVESGREPRDLHRRAAQTFPGRGGLRLWRRILAGSGQARLPRDREPFGEAGRLAGAGSTTIKLKFVALRRPQQLVCRLHYW